MGLLVPGMYPISAQGKNPRLGLIGSKLHDAELAYTYEANMDRIITPPRITQDGCYKQFQNSTLLGQAQARDDEKGISTFDCLASIPPLVGGCGHAEASCPIFLSRRGIAIPIQGFLPLGHAPRRLLINTTGPCGSDIPLVL